MQKLPIILCSMSNDVVCIQDRCVMWQRCKPLDCEKFDECWKINMVRDKDMLDSQYIGIVQNTCIQCKNDN